MDPKQLKKLIKVCRELGVKSYKGEGFEFTLTDEAPVRQVKGTKKVPTIPTYDSVAAKFESDGWETLSEEQKLFYSTIDPAVPEASDNEGVN